ncbi:DUF4160 domain-containing protein [Magnetospirillum molischianum]|uniref:DUF4160 domain-containing protein n=1 Tax=Magnetospirillum molischianum DSM 120 TaxID=1150626 RepID=H8FP46_MAGML|nr:DUF4160 domain-containing protein [Magnetospirillum molischianum]CCG40134.1 conserved hypothetical protein [Magnetospirillum molischianum DSM 120]
MPTLLVFNGFKLRLYFGDHGVPHVHLISADCAAVIAIETGEVITGDAPAAALETAHAYVAANRDALLTLWRK